MAMGVEAMTIAPGYSYPDAQGQGHFLDRQQAQQLMRNILGRRKRNWRFNQTPIYLEFLQGHFALPCTPWGSPTYNVFGWQRPCYLVSEGYCETFQQLVETTAWQEYGQASDNRHCRDCMMHCGHEPSAVMETLTSLRGLSTTLRRTLSRDTKSLTRDAIALRET